MLEHIGHFSVSGPVGGERYQVARGGSVISTWPDQASARAAAIRLEGDTAERIGKKGRDYGAAFDRLLKAPWLMSPWTKEPGYEAVCAASAGVALELRVRRTPGSEWFRLYGRADRRPRGWFKVAGIFRRHHELWQHLGEQAQEESGIDIDELAELLGTVL